MHRHNDCVYVSSRLPHDIGKKGQHKTERGGKRALLFLRMNHCLSASSRLSLCHPPTGSLSTVYISLSFFSLCVRISFPFPDKAIAIGVPANTSHSQSLFSHTKAVGCLPFLPRALCPHCVRSLVFAHAQSPSKSNSYLCLLCASAKEEGARDRDRDREGEKELDLSTRDF